jgi:hypothetical protein
VQRARRATAARSHVSTCGTKPLNAAEEQRAQLAYILLLLEPIGGGPCRS